MATTVNPNTTPPTVADYTGPASATSDVQSFRINLWENIKANNRCGGCHNATGQTPRFARNDDVNLAYADANTIVNLTQPDQSRMVIKVAGITAGCPATRPAATSTTWIRNWAGRRRRRYADPVAGPGHIDVDRVSHSPQCPGNGGSVCHHHLAAGPRRGNRLRRHAPTSQPHHSSPVRRQRGHAAAREDRPG
jgi:hypothetical protein